MERVYEYRIHIKKMRTVIPVILIVVALILLLATIILAIVSGGEFAIVIFGGVFSIILLGEAFIIWVFYERFVKVRCQLTDEGIEYTNIKKTIYIPYNEIESIEFPSIKYFGGWVKITSAKETIRLTVVIKRIQDFVMELKKEVEKCDSIIKIKEKNYQGFLRTATFSDHSWERVYSIWLKIIGLTLLSTVLSCVIYAFSGGTSGNIIIAGLIGYVIPLIAYIICEIILGRWLSQRFKNLDFTQDPGVVDRDINYEKQIYSKGTKWGSAIFVLTMLLMIGINRF